MERRFFWGVFLVMFEIRLHLNFFSNYFSMVSRKVKSSSCENLVTFALAECELIIVRTMSLICIKRTFWEGEKRRACPTLAGFWRPAAE